MKKTLTICMVALLTCSSFAGAKRMMTKRKAEILAYRLIVESVYGVKIKFAETVTDIIDASFAGDVATKTSARINGIEIEEAVYDEDRDIAKVTASVKIGTIEDLDEDFKEKFKDKIVRRVAFSTSTLEQKPKLQAMRAAQVDAYKNLLKIITGFTLESETTIENFMLKSDVVKTSVIGALMGIEMKEYRWEGKDNDAVVTVRINIKEFEEMLPERIKNMDKEYIEATGYGAGVNDYKSSKEQTKK